MAIKTITVQIRVAWWVQPYIMACAVFAALHGLRPNAEKIARFVASRGIRYKVE